MDQIISELRDKFLDENYPEYSKVVASDDELKEIMTKIKDFDGESEFMDWLKSKGMTREIVHGKAVYYRLEPIDSNLTDQDIHELILLKTHNNLERVSKNTSLILNILIFWSIIGGIVILYRILSPFLI